MFQPSLCTWISSCAGYSGYQMPYTPNRRPTDVQGSYYRSGPSAPPQHPYTAGLSEQEQFEAALIASLQDQSEGIYGLNTTITKEIHIIPGC